MRRIAAIVTVFAMTLALAACGGKKEETAAPDGQVFTGTLEEKKDFMVIAAEKDSEEAYIFQLDDGVKCEAEVGDPVKITYTGDIAKFDEDEVLVAVDITKEK